MDCSQVMKRDVRCISPDDTVFDAATEMRRYNIGFLPVCMPNGIPLGVLTDRDIVVRGMAAGLPGTTRVKDIMTPGTLVCVSHRASLQKAEDLMARNQVSRILCLDDTGHVVGVISLSDIPAHDTAERTKRVLAGIAEREARP